MSRLKAAPTHSGADGTTDVGALSPELGTSEGGRLGDAT